MKKIILFLVCCLSITVSFGQVKGAYSQRALNKTAELKTVLSLNADQEAKVLKIQHRKDKQFESIQYLLEKDPANYIGKLKSIHNGNETSIQRILNKEQLKAYHLTRKDLRIKRSELVKTMKSAGRNDASIEAAVVRLEYEFDN